MSYSIKLEKIAKQRKESRDIAFQILQYGVTEQQKYDIIFEIALSLENNDAMKQITSLVKNYRETINKEENECNNIKDDKPKIILE